MLDISITYGRSFKIIKGAAFNISVEGTTEEKDTVIINKDGSDYSIKQKNNDGNSNNISGNNININGRNIFNFSGIINISSISDNYFSTSNSKSTLDIIVTIPEKVDVNFVLKGSYETISLGDLKDIEVTVLGSGHIDIGEVNDCSLDVSGSGSVECKSSKNLSLQISGSGNIKMGNVNGTIASNISGSGNLKINNVESKKVKCSVSGAGNVNINGNIEDISCTVSGAGNIRVKNTGKYGHVIKNVSGAGNISLN